jgi:leucyl aminopeptidase
MQVSVKQGGIQTVVADAIIVNLFEGVTHPGGATGAVDQALAGLIGEVIAAGDLRGKAGETVVLYPRHAIPARRVIVVGLGQADDFDLEAVREASGVAIQQARQSGAASVATVVHGAGQGGLEIAAAAQAVVEGSLLALYRYPAQPARKKEEDDPTVAELTVVEFDEAKISAIEAGAQAGQAIAEAVWLARTMVNRPANFMTPTLIAETAQTVCGQTGLACRVLEEDEMRREGMNVLLAVTQGATEPAKFIIMEHKPANATHRQPIVLVGKGVAFDTGGYSLKPESSMNGMHGDMGGAAAVIGAMQAVGALKLPLHVIGLIPTVENMISGSAYKLNDVFAAKNGVTVEIHSTDAEGRLILADALCYADTLNPAAVIDIATLTGGKTVALGNRYSALFANDPAKNLAEALLSAGKAVGEPSWLMPLDPAYDRQLKSEVADLKNTGGRHASAITAARFLAHFIGDWPWAHLDIANGEFYKNELADTPRSYLTKGATGLGVRTFVELLRNW